MGDNFLETVAHLLLYVEEGDFADEYGSEKCLVELGCWGPVVKCIGCTMPGFPDKFTPYFEKPPGTLISSTGTKILGGVMRKLRQRTVETMDREVRRGGEGLEEKLCYWVHRRGTRYESTLDKRPQAGAVDVPTLTREEPRPDRGEAD